MSFIVRSLTAAAILFAAPLMTVASGAAAAAVIDQSSLVPFAPPNSEGSGNFFGAVELGDYELRQTVVAGLDGLLSRIDLQLYRFDSPDLSGTLSIYRGGSLAAPGTEFVGSVEFELPVVPSLNEANGGKLTRIDVSSVGFSVVAGTTFTFALTARDLTDAVVLGSNPSGISNYLPGELFTSVDGGAFEGRFNENDLGFRTWVGEPDIDVPEPASVGLLGLALLALAVRRRSR